MTTYTAMARIGLPAKPVGPGHNKPHMTCHHWAVHRLTCAEYEDLRRHAGGHCGICRIPERETRRGFLVVDHFHGTNGASFFRGMLCDWCNQSVMQCIDGLKAWGPQNRPWEEAAREYERRSWEQPSEEAQRQLDARVEKLPIWQTRLHRPPSISSWGCPDSIEMPLRKGPALIAKKLRRYLSEPQLARLVELLTEKD